MWHDFRQSYRVLLKNAWVTSAALLSLALGLGANTAIFSLLNALLLRSLPVRDPAQLVALSTTVADDPNQDQPLTLPMFEELSRRQMVFSDLFAWSGGGLTNFEAAGSRFAAGLDSVSGTYFSTLGLRPLLGRGIQPEDVALSSGTSRAVAVISYRCWQQYYAGDPEVVGKTIRLESYPYTIIGVLPRNFHGLIIDGGSDVIIPLGSPGRTGYRDPTLLSFYVLGRLKPGITFAQAQSQLAALWPHLLPAAMPPGYAGARRARYLRRKLAIQPGTTGISYLRERFSRPLWALMALVFTVLLIACANVANLLLARAAARQHEIGIRSALGASTWQIMRPMLTESLLLSGAGTVLGLLIALGSGRLLVHLVWSGYSPPTLHTSLDLRVFAFASSLGMLTGVLVGLLPAWQLTRTDPQQVLRPSLSWGHRGKRWFGRLLVSAQMALSLLLVFGALLFVRSLHKLQTVDLGYSRQQILVMQLFPQPGRTEIPHRAAYFQQLLDRLSVLPGVQSVAYSYNAPANRYEYTRPVSASVSGAAAFQATEEMIGPGFFHTVRMRLLTGRDFDWRDVETSRRVAILSESLAKRLFPGENPIGRQIDDGTLPDHKGLEVVGVANSASLWRPQSREPLAVYLPILQYAYFQDPLVDLRTAGDPKALTAVAERTLESFGYHYSLRTRTLEERTDSFLTEERVTALLASFLGTVALLLAALGLYALLSYSVSRRTAEFGIRLAVGAQSRQLLVLILRDVLEMAGLGIAVGLPMALASSHWISSLLFGLAPSDPVTVAATVILLFAVALAAGYFPARHASHMNPMTALRTE